VAAPSFHDSEHESFLIGSFGQGPEALEDILRELEVPGVIGLFSDEAEEIEARPCVAAAEAASPGNHRRAQLGAREASRAGEDAIARGTA
jgi:hypothetical protein